MRFASWALAALTVLTAGSSIGLSALAASPANVPAAIYMDPPVDPAHPAYGLGVQITNHGEVMNGMFYAPSGAGPHPVVVLIHGLPGNEQNLDLAQVLRRAGWAVVSYHYRGSWGSQGRFSIDGVLDDADAVVAELHRPEIIKRWNIDPKRIVVIGHSLGGFAAAHAGATAKDVLGTALIAPWDPSIDAAALSRLDKATQDKVAETQFDDIDGRLTGATGKDIVAALAVRGAGWKLSDNAQALATRPLFIAVAERDSESCKVPRLLPAVEASHPVSLQILKFNTDHGFNDHRIALETHLLNWISSLPGAPSVQ